MRKETAPGEGIRTRGSPEGRDDLLLRLFRVSVLKQEKFRHIERFVGDVRGKRCLDIGADNGVISLLLREKGGEWLSADLDDLAVSAILELVRSQVFKIDNGTIPLPDRSLDLIVIVDFLEHIEGDREFARELARVLKPEGKLIVNVPHIKRFSLVNRLRDALGLTEEKHGHVRPGYTLGTLSETLGRSFKITEHTTYSRAFSEIIDTAMNAVYAVIDRRKDSRTSKKGRIVGTSEVRKNRGKLAALSLIYPFLWFVAKLDHILFLQDGYKLIIKASLDTAD